MHGMCSACVSESAKSPNHCGTLTDTPDDWVQALFKDRQHTAALAASSRRSLRSIQQPGMSSPPDMLCCVIINATC